MRSWWVGAALAVLAWPLAAPASARDFQATVSGLLGRREGAIVVADPTQGRLLALVNPGLAGAAFPPGSVFKLVTGLAALEAGLAPSGQTVVCRGHYTPLGADRPLLCWKPEGHGALTLEGALAHSCNVALTQWGERAGLKALRRSALQAGFGRPPGRLPAPGERDALLPASIGEGPHMAVTPLQVASFVGAIATGRPPRPLAWHPLPPPAGTPLAAPRSLARLRTGMRGSVLFGSSHLAATPRLPLAGKTGTATYLDGTHRTYGWFAGYAPAEAPRLVVVVFLKEASGFASAAPLARQVAEAWDQAGRP